MHCVGPDTLMAFQRPLVRQVSERSEAFRIPFWPMQVARETRQIAGHPSARRPACHRDHQTGASGISPRLPLPARRFGRDGDASATSPPIRAKPTEQVSPPRFTACRLFPDNSICDAFGAGTAPVSHGGNGGQSNTHRSAPLPYPSVILPNSATQKPSAKFKRD